ncbi:YMGG-like glycine zipper-containing protein [Chitinophaga tropicalis]|uniref:Glycine zipper family protein n=1 Tax=Chitinophaga tropicalis TaxID=2683588 RepID=A0A7K1U278_9BACT|nr:YMGG-like glycine zipper-containing protein [Chitinophaga tropicalis]MVT08461.1 glycine zipper family protein [Chitinophaga tropicalis]
MKQIILTLATATILFACNSQSAQQEAIEAAKQETVDSINNVNAVKQQVIDSINTAKKARAAERSHAVSNNESTASNSEGTTTTTTKKKGWSHTAKGAVVGAGTGAVTGAILNKNDRLKGAAIGTVVGAGAGAGIGAIVDHAKKKKEANQ